MQLCRRHYLRTDKGPKHGWFYVLVYKLFVLSGLAILAVGTSALQSDEAKESDFTLVKVGISIITVAWIVSVWWAMLTLCQKGAQIDASGFEAGRQVRTLSEFPMCFCLVSLC